MAETRHKSASVLLRFQGKNKGQQAVTIELFPSEEWKGKSAGHYRLRVNGKFRDAEDGRNAYFPPEGVGKLVSRLLSGSLGVPVRENRPFLPARSLVRAPSSVLAGKTQYTVTRTCAPPHMGPDGRYMVWVYIPESGYCEVPYKELIPPRYHPQRKARHAAAPETEQETI